MQIRPAILADAKGIASVHVDSERAAYRGILPDIMLDSLSVEKQEAIWRERIADGAFSTFVADENGEILGWINFGQSRDKNDRPTTGEVLAMYVSPQKWRRGVGNALWEQAKRCLQEDGYSEVTLWVFELNDSARQFYQRIGFTVEPRMQKTVERGSKVLNVVRYRCTLRPRKQKDLP